MPSHTVFRMTSIVFTALALWMPAVSVAAQVRIDLWTVEAERIDPERYFSESVANGVIGMTSAPVPFRTKQTLINGAYETLEPGYVSCIVSTFNFLDLAFVIDGERIDQLSQVRNFRQSLGMKDAVFTTSFDFKDKAAITYKLRALRQLPYTALLEITVMAKRPIVIAPIGLLTPPQSRPDNDVVLTLLDVEAHEKVIEIGGPKTTLRLAAASGKTRYGAHLVAAAQGFLFDEPLTAAPAVMQSAAGLTFSKPLAAGATYHFALAGSTLTSAHVRDPLNEVQRLTTFATVKGTLRLIAQHERDWQELWKGDIVIEGDDETQRDVRSMIYHLYSFAREGTSYSIAPMGLTRSANGYLGHIFWDSELWMLPTLLALKPELARSLLEYRYERLPAAKRNAAAYGYRGAKFPWESAASGDEETPSGAITGPLEQHVTAVIGLAAWNYYRVTQDREWLRERGYPLIEATADFWASRVARNGPGRYDIDNVVGVDEGETNVDNNAFTNAAARENLAAATAAARVLALTPDPDWQQVRENIPILKFPDGVIRQHATYNGGAVSVADASLLAYPLKVIGSDEELRRNLNYYDRRYHAVAPAAMKKSILALLYNRLGEPETAYRHFKEAFEPIKRPPFGTLAEYATTANPYFATGAGGLVQTMLYGFGGLAITDEGLVQNPSKLPAAWKSLRLTGIGPQRSTYTVK